MSTKSLLSKTVGDIVSEGLRAARIIAAEQPIAAVDYQNGLDALNQTVKQWQTRGVHLWAYERAVLPLIEGQRRYVLGDSGTKAGYLDSFGATKIDSDASSSDTTLTVKSTTDMTASDEIGIELDDGTRQWTTISSVTNSTTVVVNDGLNDSSATGNTVYFFGEIIDKPLRLSNVMFATDADASEVPVERWARMDYMDQTDKDTKGSATAWYYRPREVDGVLNIWPTASSVTNLLYFDIRRPLVIYSDTNDALSIPEEYYMPLKWSIAAELGPEYGVPPQRQQIAEQKAFEALELALENDAEDSPLYLAPDMEPY